MRLIETTNELKRADVGYQMRVQNLESSLRYSTLEQDKLATEIQELRHRLDSRSDELKRLGNQLRDTRSENTSLQDRLHSME